MAESSLQQQPEGRMKRFAIGIDLGTTNSCSAIIREGHDGQRDDVIYDETGGRLIPSVVLFLRNKVVTGVPACAKISLMPDSVVYDAKRLMDIPHSDAVRLQQKSKWPFSIHKESIVVDETVREVTTIGVNVAGSHQRLLPEEISAHILHTIKTTAEKFVGDGALITKAVICVPANYTVPQKEATKTAAIIAGFEGDDVIIMNEPTAAALGYECHLNGGKRNIVVYDLGGGTFDVTVLTVNEGIFSVRSTGGSAELGGRDFDNNMRDEFMQALLLKEPGITLNQRQIQKLLTLCEAAKKELLYMDSTDVIMQEVLSDRTDFTYTFTREGFNELNEVLFQKTMQIVSDTLEESKLDLVNGQIHDVILVGGSTRIPQIKDLVSAHFGKSPNSKFNPDEAVAIGAARNAALLGGVRHRNLEQMSFLDVAPNHFGIATFEETFSVIILKNTPLPYTSPAVIFWNPCDDLEEIDINVFEGMNTQIAKKNRLIASFAVTDIPKGKAGTIKLTVTFELHQDGYLKVTVVISENSKTEVREIQSRKKFSTSMLDLLQRKFKENCNGIWETNLTRKRKRGSLRNENQEADDEEDDDDEGEADSEEEESHEDVVLSD